MVISKQGKVTKYIPSDEAESRGYRFTTLRTVPEGSAAHRLNCDPSKKAVEGASSTTTRWFPSLRNEYDLHEESFRLGETGYVLTLLNMSNGEDEEDFD
jgi:hypothetical protein